MAFDDGVFAVSPGVRRGVEEACAALEAVGHRIVEWTLPGAEALRLLYATLGYQLTRRFPELLDGGPVDRRVKQLIQMSRLPSGARQLLVRLLDVFGQHTLAGGARLFDAPRDAAGYRALAAEVERFRTDTAQDLERRGIQVVVSPTTALAAIRHGASHDLGLMGAYTAVFNTLGWPAGTVRSTLVRSGEETARTAKRDRALRTAIASEAGSAGLPVGVQIAGPHGADAAVLDTMRRLEAALPRQQPSIAR